MDRLPAELEAMRLVALALLFPVVLGCEAAERTPRASSASSSPTVAMAEEAAQRACSVYSQAPLWDSRDIDTNDDGVNDATEVFTATGSDDRVGQMAEDIEVATQHPQFRKLATAFDFLASVHKRGGDRSEVAEAEVGMIEACGTLGAGD